MSHTAPQRHGEQRFFSVLTFNGLAARIGASLPAGPRVGIIGGTRLACPLSRPLCRHLGAGLAAIADLVLLTGGVAGAGEAVGRAFDRACAAAGRAAAVFHILPEGAGTCDYGTTLPAGADMVQRRQVLARLAPVYVAVEGGMGTADEIGIARSQGAVVIAVAATGGAAGHAYPALAGPPQAEPLLWQHLADASLDPRQLADAAIGLVAGIVRQIKSPASEIECKTNAI